jgi:hypothetical protein
MDIANTTQTCRLIERGVEADTAYECLKPSVGSKIVERRTQQDGRLIRFIGFVIPDHRPILIA